MVSRLKIDPRRVATREPKFISGYIGPRLPARTVTLATLPEVGWSSHHRGSERPGRSTA
jgi:hypothetical protein